MDIKQETIIKGIALLLIFLTMAVQSFVIWLAFFSAGWEARRAWLQTEEGQEEQRIEIIAKREAKELRQRQRQVAKIAERLRRRMIVSFTELGFYRVLEKRGAKRKYERVVIRTKIIGLDYIVLRIDKTPWGIKPLALVEEEIVSNLRVKMQRPDIKPITTPYSGIFFFIPLKGSYAGIPEYFAWYAARSTRYALRLVPEDYPLAVSVGMAENRKFHYLNLAGSDGPHVLVAGTTGGGKTVFLNQLICTLIRRNTPDELQFCFIDLKRVELWAYRKIPHLWHKIITRAAGVPGILNALETELEARMDLFQSHDVRDLETWNEQNPDQRLPRIVVVFDEIANVMRHPDTKALMESLLANLAALARAFGIHLILCTQRPDSDVVTGLVKTNVTTRLCFNTDNWGSRVVLNNEMATGLKPRGRAVYKVGGDFTKLQAPFISDDEIKESIAISKTLVPPTPDFEISDLWRVMVAKNARNARETFALVGDHMDYQTMHTTLQAWHYRPAQRGPLVEVNEKKYMVYNGRLVAVQDGQHLPGDFLELETMEEFYGMANE